MRRFIILGSALGMVSLGCSPKQGAQTQPPSAEVGANEAEAEPASDTAADELWALMQGSFSSRAQAQADPEFFDIRLHMLPIWTDDTEARWLYVEQAVAVAQAEPYRQRVYRVSPGDDDTIISAVYTIEAPERFALAWKDPSTLEGLTKDAIELKEGCEVIMKREGPQRFSGATGDRSCPSALRGASYAHSQVTVTTEGVDSWDRGYDDAGEQVWGAVKSGYEFRHDDPDAAPVEPPPRPES